MQEEKQNQRLRRATARSFHGRMMFVIIVALIPVYGLVAWGYVRSIEDTRVAAERNAARILLTATQAHQTFIEITRQHLVSFSELDAVQSLDDQEECNELFGRLLSQFQFYENLGVASLDGEVRCSALPLTAPVNISDRQYFKKAVESKGFAAGQFQIGRITGKPTMNFGYPVYGTDGELSGIVYAAMSLEWLNLVTTGIEMENQSVFNVVDTNGILIARVPGGPEWVGADISDSDLFQSLRSGDNSFALEGVDGIERLYRVELLTIGDKNEIGAYTAMGFLTDILYRGVRDVFRREMLLLVLVTIEALMIAWLVGRRLIVMQVRYLQEIDRLKSEFVNLASHQLRAPLTAIKWSLEQLESTRLSKSSRENVESARGALDHLLRLVNDLLNIGRIESGRIKYDPKTMDVGKAVKQVLKELSGLAKSKSVTLSAEISTAKANADTRLVKEIALNLISNAVKYTPTGGNVAVVVKKSGRTARIEVRDSGIGIPEDEHARIFDRFYRASNAVKGEEEGTGLGLYIVKLFAEKHGGQVGFESKAGEGSMFWVELPM